MTKKNKLAKAPTKQATATGLRSPAAQMALGASAALAGGVLAIIYALRRDHGGR